MKLTRATLYLLPIFIVMMGCGESSPEPAQPSKERMIADLTTIHELLSNSEYMTAAGHFKGPEGVSQENIAKAMKGWLRKREISKSGIEVLDEKGTFGSIREVFPNKAGDWMERNEVANPDACYGLGYNNAEVAAIWDGTRFTFFRLDDVGKL